MRHAGLTLALLLSFQVAHAQSKTVETIRKAGALTCGIDQSEAEYSTTDEHGSRVAFDHDLCEAVAAAILGSSHRVVEKGFPDEDTAIAALRNGEVDMVATISDDLTHSTQPNIRLTRPILFDWQAFMAPRSARTTQARLLSGRKICFLAETEAEENLRAWFALRHLVFVPFPFQEQGEMDAAFVTGNCAAVFGDVTRLANTRNSFGGHSKDFRILPEILAVDPLASATRDDEAAFANIVNWTYEILLEAEEEGVTAKSIATLKPGKDARIDRLLDSARALGRPLGLADAWSVHVIEAVGNFGEIFRRDLGDAAPLNLPRALNELRTRGGLMQSLPLK